MSNCFDINAEIERLEREIAADEAEIAAIDQMLQLEDGLSGRKKLGSDKGIFVKTKGGRIELNEDVMNQQLLAGIKASRTPGVEQMVRNGIVTDEIRRGAQGRFLNYRNIDPTMENFARLSEGFAIGKKEVDPAGYARLTKTFTAEDAAKYIAGDILKNHKEPGKLLAELKSEIPFLETLPERLTRLNLARIDAVEEFLDVGDSIVEFLLENPDLPVNRELLDEVWAAGKWAMLFSEVDDLASRKIGQTLRSRRGDVITEIRNRMGEPMSLAELGDPTAGFDASKVVNMTRETVDENSIVGQLMLFVDNGDVQGLQQLITTARLVDSKRLFDKQANWRNIYAMQLSTLTSDGILSGITTLAVNNPVSSGAMLIGDSWRLMNESALKVGGLRALQSMADSYRLMLGEADAGFRLARDHYTSGRTLIESDPTRVDMTGSRALTDTEQEHLINVLLGQAWRGGPMDRTLIAVGKGYAAWRLLLHEVAKKAPDLPRVAGGATEGIAGAVNAGIDLLNTAKRLPRVPAHRVLGAQDEMIRWAAYKVSTRHLAEVEAIEVLGKEASKADIDAYIDASVSKAFNTGEVKPEDVTAYRLRYGIPRTQMTDSQITERLVNDLVGAPSLTTDISQQGFDFARGVVGQDDFGPGLVGDVSRAGERLRNNHPVLRFMLPIFRTPLRMTQRMFGTAFPVVPAFELLDDVNERMLKGNTDRVVRGKNIAALMVSAQALGVWGGLYLNGMIRGGGPNDPREKELWLANNRPYSLGPANNKAAQIQLNNIDPFGVLFLWTDMLDLASEGLKSDLDNDVATELALEGIARSIRERNAIRNLSTLFEVVSRPVRQGGTGSLERLIGSIAGQFVPNVANTRDLNRLISPEERFARQRDMTPEERELVISPRTQNARVDWIKGRLAEMTRAAVPLLGTLAGDRREVDWTGYSQQNPRGLKVDAFVRFVPQFGAKHSPVHQWLLKNGVTSKPRANGNLEGITMNDPLESHYRELMYSVAPGEMQRPSLRMSTGNGSTAPSLKIPVSQVVPVLDAQGAVVATKVSHTEKIDVGPLLDRVTKDANLYDALNRLRNDPMVQRMEQNEALGQMDLTRKEENRGPVQQLISLVVDYYDTLAIDNLRRSRNPAAVQWREEQAALVREQSAREQRRLNGGIMDLLQLSDYNTQLRQGEAASPLEVLQGR